MTKKEYIEKHPRTILSQNLQSHTDWEDWTPIRIISGLDAPNNKNSNLYKALELSTRGEYVIGGRRQYATQGYWIAVA